MTKMTKFDKENLSNIYNKILYYKANEELIDSLNQAVIKYPAKERNEFIEFINDVNADYEKVDEIKNYEYLFDIAKKPYANLNELKQYHKAMYEVNVNDNYEDLFEIYNKDNNSRWLISDYMVDNQVYSADDLRYLMDTDLQKNGMDSYFIYLINPYHNSYGEYLQINAYTNGFNKQYWSDNELYEDLYNQLSTDLDKNFFDNLKVQERKLKM